MAKKPLKTKPAGRDLQAVAAMSAKEFQAAIAMMDLSQVRAGLWMNVSGRQGQRYATGDQEVPGPVAILIRLTLHLGLSPDQVTLIASKPVTTR